MADFTSSRIHAVVSPSTRLRDELLAREIAGWNGPIKRVMDPADVDRIVVDLDTPSLFDPPSLWLIRCDEKWVKKQRDRLLPLIGLPMGNGAVMLIAGALEGGEDRAKALSKALDKAGALHRAEVPGDREAQAWLIARLGAQPHPVERPAEVAQTLLDRVGTDVDALLAVLDVALAHAGDQPLTAADVAAIAPGLAARPVWDFTGALVEGNARKAIELMHASGGMEPGAAIAAVIGELRKLLACTETRDDGEAAAWSGAKGRPNLYYARRRADATGRANLLRVYRAALHAQAQLRTGGTDHTLAMEMLVLHAQRVVRPSGGIMPLAERNAGLRSRAPGESRG